MAIRTILLWIVIVSLAGAAGLGIYAVVADSYGMLDGEIVVTALLAGGFSLCALFCAIVIDRHTLVPMMWAGLVASVVAFLIWTVLLWSGANGRSAEEFTKVAVTITVLAAWCAHTGLLALPRLDRDFAKIVRGATVVAAGMLGVLGVALAWFTDTLDDDLTARVLIVLFILTLCGTAVSPTLALVEAVKRRSEPEALGDGVDVDLNCPRCGAEQRIRSGVRRCSACGLRITVLVQEPRCRCGYLLYHFEGDRCPECGREIADEDRWRASNGPAPPGASA